VGERVTRRRRKRRDDRKGGESTDESEEMEEKGSRTVDGEGGLAPGKMVVGRRRK